MPSDDVELPVETPRADDSGPPARSPAPPNSSTSGDELTASLIEASPDPLLGEFVNGSSADVETPAPADGDRAQEPAAGADSSEAFKALAGLDLGRPSAGPPVGAVDRSVVPRSNEAAAEEDEELEEHDDEVVPARGSSLAFMLLASYASAVTLGLIWVLWTGRRLHESAAVDSSPPVDARSDPGQRAADARRVVAPKPIAENHLATLGQTIVLGAIEVTPLEVASGPVQLERKFGDHERRSGGENALKLRLRLRNASTDVVLAPLDEAFLRDRPQADPDSFIEVSGGGPPIAQFPLAVESEWTIVGQEFRDLRPGDVLETLVVSAPEAFARKAPEMTWRIRLRTDLNHTDDLGVRFHESDIKPGPARRAATTSGPPTDGK